MLSLRLGFENQKKEDYIRELIAVIGRHPGSCDEVWLATDYGYPAPEKHFASARLLGRSASLLREAGLRVSLQLSNSIGHGSYMAVRDCSAAEGFEHFVDVDGITAELSFCWYGKRFRNYLAETLRRYCREIRPHRVWIDDDFRCDNHHPAGRGCLCDDCLRRFNDRWGTAFDRSALTGAVREEYLWRVRLSSFLREGLCDLAAFLARVVREASPESSLGCQHGVGVLPFDRDFAELFRTLQRESGKTVGSRPGAGTYQDHDPNDMLRKLDAICYQNSLCAGVVDEIRPEIENFPHVCFGKSSAGTCLETSLYLAGGADAMSYATLMYDFEPLSWHEEFFRDFAAHRRYWEQLAALSRATLPCGLTRYLPKDVRRAAGAQPYDRTGSPWYGGSELQRCGIPICFPSEGEAPLYMLTAETAALLTREDVEFLAGKATFCGGDALFCLQQKGFGDLFGASASPCRTQLLFEVFTDHPINGDAAGRRWENGLLQPFGSFLTDLTGDTEVLGFYQTDGSALPFTAGEFPYGISSALVGTARGAKWLVTGQYPWTPVISWEKRRQLLKGMDAVSGLGLPVLSEGRQQLILFPRQTAEGRTKSVSVLNPTVGEAAGIVLTIRRPAGKTASVIFPDGHSETLPGRTEADSLTVTLPAVSPWNLATVILS